MGKKLTDSRSLESYLGTDALQNPDMPETLLLDVTSLSAEAAAEQIAAHINAIHARLVPATNQHLWMC